MDGWMIEVYEMLAWIKTVAKTWAIALFIIGVSIGSIYLLSRCS